MMHRPQPTVATTAPSRTRGLVPIGASILALALTACGAGHSSQPSTTTGVAAASTPTSTTTPAPAPAPPAPHLRIVSPRRGAHTEQTLTIRLSLTGAPAAGQRGFRYILGGRLTRVGSARLTFHGLAAGHQHLVVALASRRSVKASVSFTVIAPPPPASAPAMSAPASTAAPAPMTPPSTMQAAPAPMTPPSTMHAASGGSGT